MKKKRIIGVDPGTRVTGFGIVEINGNQILPLDFGCIRPPANYLLSDRYQIIYESLQQLLERYTPDEMAIETPFISKNAQSALKLGIAMGCSILAAKAQKMKVFGYSPREVKCFISGTGKASKNQIQNSVSRFLMLKSPPKPHDAADALAIALCHASFPVVEFLKTQKTREL